MPRLDDPNAKLKTIKPFKRERLRPWDDVESFKPTQPIIENNRKRNIAPIPTKSSKKEAIGKQLVSKKETIGKQLVSKKEAIGKQLVSKKEAIGKPISNQMVSENNKLASYNTRGFNDLKRSIQMLSGQQKKLIYYIVEHCKSSGLLYTGPITNESLRTLLKTSAKCVKTTVQRLIKKGVFFRKDSKRGLGGFTVFEIPEAVRNIVIDEQEKSGIGKQLVSQMVSNWQAEREAEAPVVSSSIINNITTTTSVSTQYEAIDCTPLEAIGFSRSHLLQIQRAYEQKPEIALPIDILQDSIHALAFDLKHNGAAADFKKSPAVILTSLLKKGQPYACKTPERYQSPREEALSAYWTMKNHQHQNRLALEQKLQQTEYDEWLATLSDDELLAFTNPEDFASLPQKTRRLMQRRSALSLSREHFNAEVWPKRREELLERFVLDNKANNLKNPEEPPQIPEAQQDPA